MQTEKSRRMQIRNYEIKSLLSNLDFEWRVATNIDIGITGGNLNSKLRPVCESYVKKEIYDKRRKPGKTEYRYKKFFLLTSLLYYEVDLLKDADNKVAKSIIQAYLDFMDTVEFSILMKSTKAHLIKRINKLAPKEKFEWFLNEIKKFISINFGNYTIQYMDFNKENRKIDWNKASFQDYEKKLCYIFDAKVVDKNRKIVDKLKAREFKNQAIICDKLMEAVSVKDGLAAQDKSYPTFHI